MIIKNGDIRNIALLTGAYGTGKSTVMRHDIKDCYEHTKDTIVIIDCYGECTELVKSLGGTEIILPNKFNSFNPFFPDMDYMYLKTIMAAMTNYFDFPSLTHKEKDFLKKVIDSNMCHNINDLKEALVNTSFDLKTAVDYLCKNKIFSNDTLFFDKKSRIISVNLRYVPDGLLPVAYIYAINYIKNNLQPKNTIRFYFEGLDYILRTQIRTSESIKYFKRLFKHSKRNHEIIVFVGYDEDFIATKIFPSDIVVLVFNMSENYLNELVYQDIIPAQLVPLINCKINSPRQFKYVEVKGNYVAIVLCDEYKYGGKL